MIEDEYWLDLIMFETWLSILALVHKRYSIFKGERKEEYRRGGIGDEKFSKTSNLSAITKVKVTNHLHTDHCSLADDTHEIWI